MAEELNDQERRETELWQVLDWSLWGNGLGDVLRESIADKTFAAITVEERETAERCIKAWHERRGPSMAVGEGTELAKRVAYLEARVGELNNTIGELRASIADIDAHATPVGLLHNDDPEGSPHHYLLTVGALHRALGKAYTAEPCESERARLRVEVDRLRREVEFEANGTAFASARRPAEADDFADIVAEFGNLNTYLTEQVTEKLLEFYDVYPKQPQPETPVCVCSIGVLGPRWSVPQCAVHPDGDVA